MATSNTYSKKPKSSAADYREYARLRTLTDSVELGAIRYFLAGPDKGARLAKVEKLLHEALDFFWREVDSEPICPEGYTNCHGACVPYQCPD
jgi:hypothetical protein